jgi:hypothetical protein
VNTQIRKLVLLPRFTTYAAAEPRSFHTVPINVREFASAIITVWRGPAIGTSTPGLDVFVQQSTDLQIWNNLGSASAEGETTIAVNFDFEWMRLEIYLSGEAAACTCWAIGDFATRTPRDTGGG